jgi:hypothetical protein
MPRDGVITFGDLVGKLDAIQGQIVGARVAVRWRA